MLLTNGRIHTMDTAGSVVDSLVIREGRVAFAGQRGDINPAAREPALDLGGRAVVPGLVDGHGHLMLLARARLELNLAAAGSEDEIARMVAVAPGGEYLTAGTVEKAVYFRHLIKPNGQQFVARTCSPSLSHLRPSVVPWHARPAPSISCSTSRPFPISNAGGGPT